MAAFLAAAALVAASSSTPSSADVPPLTFGLSTSAATSGSIVTGTGTGCPDVHGTSPDDPDGKLWFDDDLALVNSYTPIDSRPDGSFSFSLVVPSATAGEHPIHLSCGASSTVRQLQVVVDARARVERWAGQDRYRSAVEFSRHAYPAGVDTAFVASGQDYPDGLAAAPAAAIRRGPTLLTQRDVLPSVTASELLRLRPRQIVIVGGPGSVSEAVAARLRSLLVAPVSRWYGHDRYATAATVATRGLAGQADMIALLASGEEFPDALSGGAAAAAWLGPLLLTTPRYIPAPTLSAIRQFHLSGVVIAGGTGVVSSGVQQQLMQFGNLGISRAAGSDRYATSALVSARVFHGVPGRSPAVVAFIASGTTFPDALGGAAVAGLARGPVLLTSPTTVPAPVLTELRRLRPSKIVILGGTGAVSVAVEKELLTFMGVAP